MYMYKNMWICMYSTCNCLLPMAEADTLPGSHKPCSSFTQFLEEHCSAGQSILRAEGVSLRMSSRHFTAHSHKHACTCRPIASINVYTMSCSLHKKIMVVSVHAIYNWSKSTEFSVLSIYIVCLSV